MYNCKDEELPVICTYGYVSLINDLPALTAYSPKINQKFADTFLASIKNAKDLIAPELETLLMTELTKKIYGAIHSLSDPINWVSGYFGNGEINPPISDSAFGISKLRDAVNALNIEAVIDRVKTLKQNIKNHETVLKDEGLTDELVSKFDTAVEIIESNLSERYKIVKRRAGRVAANIAVFNDLHKDLKKVLRADKAIYKATDPVKLREYFATHLKGRAHKVIKTETEAGMQKSKN